MLTEMELFDSVSTAFTVQTHTVMQTHTMLLLSYYLFRFNSKYLKFAMHLVLSKTKTLHTRPYYLKLVHAEAGRLQPGHRIPEKRPVLVWTNSLALQAKHRRGIQTVVQNTSSCAVCFRPKFLKCCLVLSKNSRRTFH